MSFENSTSFEEEKNGMNEITGNLSTTRNVMKKKFSAAFANRVESENNQIRDKQSIPIETMNDAISHSISKYSNMSDPNILCDRLRLLSTKMIEGEHEQLTEVHSIIMRLRELEILL